MSKKLCGAKTRPGTPCQRAPMSNGRCYLHGGKSPKGAAHPNFRHGNFSQYLPQRLMNIYDDIQGDPAHFAIERNIRVREAFLRDRLQDIDDAPESQAVWASFRKALDAFRKAWANEDYGLAEITLTELDRIIDERLVYYEAVREIRTEMNEQRNDKKAIAAIEYKGENAVTMPELLTFVGAVLNLVSTHVSNQNEQRTIYDAIEHLVSVDESNTRAVTQLPNS